MSGSASAWRSARDLPQRLGGIGDLVDKEVRLPAGSRLLITATGTIKPGVTGTIVNTATVAAPDGFIELAPANNTATDGDTELERRADLAIEKIACSDPLDCAATEVDRARAGDDRSTTRSGSTTTGSSDVEGATVSDVLPEMLSDAVLELRRRAGARAALLAAAADRAAVAAAPRCTTATTSTTSRAPALPPLAARRRPGRRPRGRASRPTGSTSTSPARPTTPWRSSAATCATAA